MITLSIRIMATVLTLTQCRLPVPIGTIVQGGLAEKPSPAMEVGPSGDGGSGATSQEWVPP